MPAMSANPWFVDAFTADYLDVYAHRDEAAAAREAQGVLSLLRHDRASQRLLELAAGAGRHALAFAAQRCHVTCLDLSADLTARARAAGLRTVRGDMRELPFRDWSFDTVTCLFSSFGYFADDADHERSLREIARVLTPGGRVLLDLMDRETVSRHLVPQGMEVIGETTVEVERAVTRDGRRVEKSIRMIRSDHPARAWRESVRLFTADELDALATRARLELEASYGDYDGRPHESGRTRRLVVLRRPR
jgi:SAM-dependent methyltransferase